MKTGRMPENIWKRSVGKNLKDFADSSMYDGTTAADCGKSDSPYFVSEPCMVPKCECMGRLIVDICCDALLTRAVPEDIMLELLTDGRMPEEYVAHIAKDAASEAKKQNINIRGFNVHTLPGLKKAYITGVASSSIPLCKSYACAKNDMDIIVTKWIGLSGTVMLGYEKSEELKNRYPEDYIEKAKSFIDILSVYDEMEILKDTEGIGYISSVSETGIFGRLWNMAEKSKTGFDIDLQLFPFRQETIEICNELDADPYILSSAGSLLIAAESVADIAGVLNRAGIPAAVIGKTTGNNDKLIRNRDEIRYLTKPGSDEIYRILG